MAGIRGESCSSTWPKLFDVPGRRFLAAIALAAIVVMLAAGMFEYNFGDSEFLMLLLMLVTLPLRRGPEQVRVTKHPSPDQF